LASRSNSLDWKYYRSGWQYSTDAPQNKKWKKDRAELFKKNGNGWWYYHGYILRSNKLDKNEKRLFADGDRATLRREVEAAVLQEIQLAMLESGTDKEVEDAKADLKSE